jgi:hypothetical protein
MRKQRHFWRFGAGLLLLSCGLVLAGCGGGQGTIAGKVTYQGKPLKGGNVAIISKSGGGAHNSAIEEDGSYSVSKVPPGPAMITVETASLRPAPKGNAPGPYAKMPKDMAPPGPNSQADPKRYVPIPDQYANPDSSGLTLDVKGGSQTHNIDLK